VSVLPTPGLTDATSTGDVAEVGMRRVFAWGFLAQVFSSATNFGLIVIAGRLLGPAGLGVVVIGYAGYQLVAGLQRATIIQPTVAHAAPLSRSERRWFAESSLTVATCSGAVATVCVAAVGVGVGGNIGRGLLIFAPWMIVALLQELWKTILFQEGHGRGGAASDCVRLGVIVLSIPVALHWRRDYVVVGGWGAAAAAGLVVAMMSYPGRPERLRTAFAAWPRRVWGLGRWLGAREVVFQLLAYATILLLAVILGSRNLGGLRSAEALFSPFSLVAAGLVLPALPALSRAISDARGHALRLAFRICAVAVAFGVIYMAVMAVAGPWLLVHLFGRSFAPFKGLVWPMAAAQVVNAAGVSFTLLLSAEKRGRASFIAGVLFATATLGFATGLAVAYGVSGAAWGMVVGAGVGSAAVIHLALRRRSSDDVPSPGDRKTAVA
jgi:O-antigen/teichoic acid export membrane protein